MRIFAVNGLNPQQQQKTNYASSGYKQNSIKNDTFSKVSFGMTPVEEKHFAKVYSDIITPFVEGVKVKLTGILEEAKQVKEKPDFDGNPYLVRDGNSFKSFAFSYGKKSASDVLISDLKGNPTEEWSFNYDGSLRFYLENLPEKITSVFFDCLGNPTSYKVFEPGKFGYALKIENGKIVDTSPLLNKGQLYF